MIFLGTTLIRFVKKLEMTRTAEAATRNLIRMSYFTTTGVVKFYKELLSLFQKQQENELI